MNSLTSYLQQAMTHDLSVVQHLITKLPESAWDYRPRENMRSTTELLRYLSFIGAATVKIHRDGGWLEHNLPGLREARERTVNLQPKDFHDAIESQKHAIKELFTTISDEDLYQKTTLEPWGTSVPLLQAYLNGTLKYLASYKMQLFIYAKSCGAEIATPNNWRGVDPTPKA